jgi:putative salt-induced outer membrane protein YdiY
MNKRMRMKTIFLLCAVICLAAPARGDEVIFKNGDRLTGTVKSVDGGKLKIDTKVAGVVTVDMKDVQTFTTDASVQMRMQDNSIVRDKIAANADIPATQPATQPAAVVANGKAVAVTDIKRLNAAQAWTGSVLVNGNLSRGNTHTEALGIAADATLRRDDEVYDDRFSLTAGYNFGNQTVDGVSSTSADNWFAQMKYDKFFTEKWYGYGLFRYDHDRLAFLNYRLSPGVGVGYQWIESADFNFRTEAGLSYVYEDYSTGGTDDRVALRLAYHVDKKLNPDVSLFHNLEWLPGIMDPGDYNLNADAGVRAKLTDSMFSEFKLQYQRDSTPAPGALKNDIQMLLGVGWQF